MFPRLHAGYINYNVAVNLFLQLIFIFPLFLGMIMYDNEFKTKEE